MQSIFNGTSKSVMCQSSCFFGGRICVVAVTHSLFSFSVLLSLGTAVFCDGAQTGPWWFQLHGRTSPAQGPSATAVTSGLALDHCGKNANSPQGSKRCLGHARTMLELCCAPPCSIQCRLVSHKTVVRVLSSLAAEARNMSRWGCVMHGWVRARHGPNGARVHTGYAYRARGRRPELRRCRSPEGPTATRCTASAPPSLCSRTSAQGAARRPHPAPPFPAALRPRKGAPTG